MINLKNLYLAFKYQLPFSHLMRRIFSGNIKGLLSKRSHYRSNGNEKVKYPTVEKAQKAADRLQKLKTLRFSVYKCIYCDAYHIGANRYELSKKQ